MASSPPNTKQSPPSPTTRTTPDTSEPAVSEYNLTVEQLASEVGMSVRNIRNHQSRGLLPAPEVRARVGYYNAEHIERLRLILDMQADGFNLAAIERLLSGSDGLAKRLLGLRTAVTTPYDPEAAEFITAEELLKRFGDVDSKDVERVRRMKLLIPVGDERFECSGALDTSAYRVVQLGLGGERPDQRIELPGHQTVEVRHRLKLIASPLVVELRERAPGEELWHERHPASLPHRARRRA